MKKTSKAKFMAAANSQANALTDKTMAQIDEYVDDISLKAVESSMCVTTQKVLLDRIDKATSTLEEELQKIENDETKKAILFKEYFDKITPLKDKMFDTYNQIADFNKIVNTRHNYRTVLQRAMHDNMSGVNAKEMSYLLAQSPEGQEEEQNFNEEIQESIEEIKKNIEKIKSLYLQMLFRIDKYNYQYSKMHGDEMIEQFEKDKQAILDKAKECKEIYDSYEDSYNALLVAYLNNGTKTQVKKDSTKFLENYKTKIDELKNAIETAKETYKKIEIDFQDQFDSLEKTNRKSKKINVPKSFECAEVLENLQADIRKFETILTKANREYKSICKKNETQLHNLPNESEPNL